MAALWMAGCEQMLEVLRAQGLSADTVAVTDVPTDEPGVLVVAPTDTDGPLLPTSFSMHPASALVVSGGDDPAAVVARLRFAPGVPTDTAVTAPDGLPEAVLKAIERVIVRNSHRETIGRLSAHVANPFAPQSGSGRRAIDTPDTIDIDGRVGRAEANARWFRTLFERSSVGMAVLSSTTEILGANEAMSEILGRPAADLEGMRLAGIVEGDSELVETARRVLDGNLLEAGGELQVRRPDGSLRWINATVVATRTDERQTVLLQVVDTTARHQVEVVLVNAYTSARETAEHLRKLDHLKDGFLSVVGHEIRTPLMVLSGAAQTIDAHHDQLSRDQMSTLLTSIVSNARRLDQLTTDLLDLGRIERGVMTPQPAETLVANVVIEAVEQLDLSDHPLTVRVTPVMSEATVDAVWVERIIVNLLTNARRYTPAGTQLELSADVTDEDVTIRLADHGPGIDEDERERLFERYRQGRSGRSIGSGVGLSLIGEFCQLHGGRAHVEETPGGGATFVARLAQLKSHAHAESREASLAG